MSRHVINGNISLFSFSLYISAFHPFFPRHGQHCANRKYYTGRLIRYKKKCTPSLSVATEMFLARLSCFSCFCPNSPAPPPRFSFHAFKPSVSVYSAPDDVFHATHAILLKKLKRQTPTAK